MKRKRDNAADVDSLARFLHSFAVDPDMSFLDECLGEGSALHQPNAVKKAIDPHFFFNFASSAKA